jgi:hypothetical protein
MQDGSWGLIFMIFTTIAFRRVIVVDAVWEHEFIESLVWLLQYPKLLGCFMHLLANPSRWEFNVECIIWCLQPMMKSSFFSSMVVDNIQSSGARSALLIGVAPGAIVELYLFEYRLKVSLGFIIIFVLQKIFFTFWFFFYRVRDQRSRWR